MKKIKDLIGNLVTNTTTIFRNINQEPAAQAHLLDVDTVHDALRCAEAGECQDLFAIYRDILASHSHILSEFQKRKLAVLNDPLVLTPDDPEDQAQVDFIKNIERHLNDQPNLIFIFAHLLDSSLYPVAVAERLYRESSKLGWRYEIAKMNVVPHTHLTWDQDGQLSRRLTSDGGHFTGAETPILNRDFIIHRGHLLTSVPDWWGGPMRSILFWWLFSVMSRDWWARFLDRYGSPFLVGKYDTSDDQSRAELQHAFSFATKIGGLAISREADVNMVQANTSGGGDAFESFHSAANREFSKLIVGQTLSAEGQNLGLGGGQAGVQAAVRDDIRQFDANNLGHTIKTQLLKPLWAANAWSVPLPTVSWGADIEEAEVNGALVASLAQAGITVTDDGLKILGNRVGFPLERSNPAAGLSLAALSAQNDFDTAALIPTAERRMERKRQARGATEKIIAAASPQLSAILRRRYSDIQDAIEQSTSAEDAQIAVAKLTADFDPTEAAAIVQHTLSACSSNALLATDN